MKRLLPFLALFALAGAGAAQAQETQTLRFLDTGKPPTTSIPVSRFLNGQKTDLATTGTDGTVSLPIDALGFGKGETVVVWVKRCEDGRVTEIILTRENEDNPCPPEEGADVGERCGCEKAGVFVVGDGPATINIGRPGMFQQIGFGVGIDYYNWINFEDVSGNQPGVITHDASTTSTGFQAFAEYPCSRFPLSVGFEGSYTTLDTRTSYLAEGDLVRMQTGDISYLAVGPYVRFHPRTGRFQPYGKLSTLFAWNEADFESEGVTEHRTHDTWRAGFGGGVQYNVNPKLAVLAEGTYSTTFKSNDADDHARWKFGVLYRPGGFHVNY